jgi:EpsI family protein
MLAAAWYVDAHPAVKRGAGERLELSTLVPPRFGRWVSRTYDTSGYTDRWQSVNELLARAYYEPSRRQRVLLVTEYNSDLRKNFAFHFPERCHRAGGNEVIALPPLQVALGEGRLLTAKCLYIKGKRGSPEPVDKVVAYWITVDGKATHRTFLFKLDQVMAGLVRGSRKGLLMRVDYPDVAYRDDRIEGARSAISGFLESLYRTMDQRERGLLFGASAS